MRLSASAWSARSFAPMFSPTSTSAISIEMISNAVCASSPFASTVFEMRSGFSSTSLCDGDDAVDVRAHGHLGFYHELNAVHRDRVDRLAALRRIGAVNDFGIYARVH